MVKCPHCGAPHECLYYNDGKRRQRVKCKICDTLPAIITMNVATRTAKSSQKLILITNGNPANPSWLYYLNSKRESHSFIEHRKVIGLQNLDEESEINRLFKQIIELFNRTYKYHIGAANGFKSKNSAVCFTTLFVSRFNFRMPQMALNYKNPIPVKELENIQTIQNKWCKIINVAAKLWK